MTARPKPWDRIAFGNAVTQGFEDAPGGIGTAVIHHYDFMRNSVNAQFHVKMFDHGADAAFLVESGHYD
jgi:hypothetical protein